VYQGAPTPVTAYLAVASKAAGFMVLLGLLHGPFFSLQGFLVPALVVISGASILFGNIAAVTQGNLKRLLGLSGVAHAGYLLMGVVASCSVEWADRVVVFYLVTYLLASFAVFAVLSIAEQGDDAETSMESYRNLSQRQPFLGGVLTLGLGSLAGIPPLGGFIAKLFLFVAAFQAGLYGLLAVAVLGVVISIYYYFGWIRTIYFKSSGNLDEEKSVEPLEIQARCVMGALAAATILLGVFPGVLSLL
jgi:NADH-quinone oxidoreductase subunit N